MTPEEWATVYEALNKTTREALVGLTSRPVDDLSKLHRAAPPPVIAHWGPDHEVVYREVEARLPAKDAAAFLEAYARSFRGSGWKTLVWRGPEEA